MRSSFTKQADKERLENGWGPNRESIKVERKPTMEERLKELVELNIDLTKRIADCEKKAKIQSNFSDQLNRTNVNLVHKTNAAISFVERRLEAQEQLIATLTQLIHEKL